MTEAFAASLLLALEKAGIRLKPAKAKGKGI